MSDDDLEEATRLVSRTPEPDEATVFVRKMAPDDATTVSARDEIDDERTRLVARPAGEADEHTRYVRTADPEHTAIVAPDGDADERTMLHCRTISREPVIPVDLPGGRQAFVPGGVSATPGDRYGIREAPIAPAPIPRMIIAEAPSRHSTPSAARPKKRRGLGVIIAIVVVTIAVATIVIGVAFAVLTPA